MLVELNNGDKEGRTLVPLENIPALMNQAHDLGG